MLKRRDWLLGSAALLLGCAPAARVPGIPALQLLGETRIAHRQDFRGTTVGGLSAIDHDPQTGLFHLLSDDRSDLQPARLYSARLSLGASGLAPVELLDVTTLKQADGSPWPNRRNAVAGIAVPDPEALRRLPNGHFLWSSEGDYARAFPPALYEADADGRLLRQFQLPACFSVGPEHGARDNLGFEGLALNSDGTRAWVAMEGPLRQDGPPPRVGIPGGPCRFTEFDLRTGKALRQIAYVPDAIPAEPLLPGVADNGVSEILMHNDRHLLVLERAYMAGRGNSLRLYLVDTQGPGNTLELDSLTPGNHEPAHKTLLADFAGLGLSLLDNTEGMSWGPPLPDGRRTLWVVSDDNFNPTQVTQIAAFAFADAALAGR